MAETMTGRRAVAIICALIIVLGAALPVLAAPGSTACAVAGLLPLDQGPDGQLFDRSLSPGERLAATDQVGLARSRITSRLGQPEAEPLIIQLATAESLWPLALSPLAGTYFVGTRACLIIGPDGRNVDVTAHELVHAEIFQRVGSWQRQMHLPTWFDEGAAMQVDDRTGFDVPPNTPDQVRRSVQSATTYRQFFDVSPPILTRNFALAKFEVGHWIARIGSQTFYSRLAEMRNGRKFKEVWSEKTSARENPSAEKTRALTVPSTS